MSEELAAAPPSERPPAASTSDSERHGPERATENGRFLPGNVTREMKEKWPPRAHRYIRYLENGGSTVLVRACKALRCTKRTIELYRATLMGFRQAESNAKAKGKEAKAKTREATPPITGSGAPRINVTGLEQDQVTYLLALLQLGGDRSEACKAADVPWRIVKQWLKESVRFREEFFEVREETILIASEDGIAAKAAKGDVAAARMYLVANDPRYRRGADGDLPGDRPPSGNVDAAGVREADDWLMGFARQVEANATGEAAPGEQPPADDVDVEEAELDAELAEVGG